MATVNRFAVPEDYLDRLQAQRGGFDFEMASREKFLSEKLPGSKPAAKKTGTTIAGIVCKEAGCVILGADTRATEGSVVADKNCLKLHQIANSMVAAGAGTAADLDMQCEFMRADLELLRMATGRDRCSPFVSRLSSKLFQYQGNLGCALIFGGVDDLGPSLHQIAPHGSASSALYATFGSGSLAAMSQLETGYKVNLTQEEGVDLMISAIEAGIFNDLGSGSNVDIAVITKTGTETRRSVRAYNKRLKAREAMDLSHLVLLGEKVVTEFPAADVPADVPADVIATAMETS